MSYGHVTLSIKCELITKKSNFQYSVAKWISCFIRRTFKIVLYTSYTA